MAWAGFSNVCPDLPESEGFRLEGDSDAMHAMFFEFTIDRCTDGPGKPKCKSEKEINDFIETFQIQTW